MGPNRTAQALPRSLFISCHRPQVPNPSKPSPKPYTLIMLQLEMRGLTKTLTFCAAFFKVPKIEVSNLGSSHSHSYPLSANPLLPSSSLSPLKAATTVCLSAFGDSSLPSPHTEKHPWSRQVDHGIQISQLARFQLCLSGSCPLKPQGDSDSWEGGLGSDAFAKLVLQLAALVLLLATAQTARSWGAGGNPGGGLEFDSGGNSM